MSYRPITDVWLLGRPKTGYYGSYPAGFLTRARNVLGVHRDDPVLHVCGGKLREHKCGPACPGDGTHYHGVGLNDRTVDLDPTLTPDFVQDVREPLPHPGYWAAVLADPPYSPEDAAHYTVGAEVFPSAGEVLRNCCAAVRPGGRVGIIHYEWPGPPSGWREVAAIAVGTGRRAKARWFTVWEAE